MFGDEKIEKTKESNPNVDDIELEILQQYEKALKTACQKIEKANEHAVVMAIGDVGHGKSTIVAYLMGEDFARVKGNIEPLRPEDKDKEGSVFPKRGSKMTAKSMYPEAYHKKELKFAFVDCPGFDKKAQTPKQICANFATRIVVRRTVGIKGVIIPIADHHLRPAGRGKVFKDLCEKLSEFFDDPVIIRSSLCFIVNDNTHFPEGEIKENIRQIIMQLKTDCKEAQGKLDKAKEECSKTFGDYSKEIDELKEKFKKKKRRLKNEYRHDSELKAVAIQKHAKKFTKKDERVQKLIEEEKDKLKQLKEKVVKLKNARLLAEIFQESFYYLDPCDGGASRETLLNKINKMPSISKESFSFMKTPHDEEQAKLEGVFARIASKGLDLLKESKRESAVCLEEKQKLSARKRDLEKEKKKEFSSDKTGRDGEIRSLETEIRDLEKEKESIDGCTLLLMSELPKTGELENGKMYLEKQDNRLKYIVKNPRGKKVTGYLNISIPELTKESLLRERADILKRTSKKSCTLTDDTKNIQYEKSKIQKYEDEIALLESDESEIFAFDKPIIKTFDAEIDGLIKTAKDNAKNKVKDSLSFVPGIEIIADYVVGHVAAKAAGWYMRDQKVTVPVLVQYDKNRPFTQVYYYPEDKVDLLKPRSTRRENSKIFDSYNVICVAREPGENLNTKLTFKCQKRYTVDTSTRIANLRQDIQTCRDTISRYEAEKRKRDEDIKSKNDQIKNLKEKDRKAFNESKKTNVQRYKAEILVLKENIKNQEQCRVQKKQQIEDNTPVYDTLLNISSLLDAKRESNIGRFVIEWRLYKANFSADFDNVDKVIAYFQQECDQNLLTVDFFELLSEKEDEKYAKAFIIGLKQPKRNKLRDIPDDHCALLNGCLLIAAKKGFTKIIGDLLDLGAEINYSGSIDSERYESTALHWVCGQGHVSSVELLLNKNVDLDKRDSYGASALHVAIQNKQLDVVKLLINRFKQEQSESLLDAKDMKSNTPLHYASRYNYFDGAELLVQEGANVERKNEEEKTFLDLVPEENRSQYEKLVAIKFYVDIETLNQAIKNNDKVTILASCKNDCSSKIDNKGNNVLHQIVKFGTVDLVSALYQSSHITKDMVRLLNDNEETPCHVAAKYKNKALLLYLLNELKGEIDVEDKEGYRVIEYMVEYDWVEKAVLASISLTKFKHVIKEGPNQGLTPLFLAIRYRAFNMLKYLLVQDCSLKDFKLQPTLMSPVHYAAQHQNPEAIDLLYQFGADVGALDSDQKTPLHIAVSVNAQNKSQNERQKQTVMKLVKLGASLKAKDKNQKKPADLASSELSLYLQSFEEQDSILGETRRLEDTYDSFVFQGGSVRGLAYIGALEEFEKELGDVSQIKRFGGTSAGAITALLLALRYSISDVKTIISDLDFTTMLDGHDEYRERIFEISRQGFYAYFQELSEPIKKLYDVLQEAQAGGGGESGIIKKFILKYTEGGLPIKEVKEQLKKAMNLKELLERKLGIFDGEVLRNKFNEFINKQVKDKTGKEIDNVTFRELKELGCFCDLYCVGVNINIGQAEIFSYEHTPDLIVADAVRISMSIPVVFKPHYFYIKKHNERVISEEKKNVLYMDGGITDNYPISIFDRSSYCNQKNAFDGVKKYCYNKRVLGFRLLEGEKWKEYEFGERVAPSAITGIFSLIKAVALSVGQKQESDHNLSLDRDRTVYIDTVDVGVIDFNLDENKKNRLVNSGVAGMQAFLKRRVTSGSDYILSTDLLKELVINALTNDSIMQLDRQQGHFTVRNLVIRKDSPQIVYSMYRNQEAIRIGLLKDLDINIRAQDQEGNTALHIAVLKRDLMTFEKLAEVDPYLLTMVNYERRTVLDLAEEMQCVDIIQAYQKFEKEDFVNSKESSVESKNLTGYLSDEEKNSPTSSAKNPQKRKLEDSSQEKSHSHKKPRTHLSFFKEGDQDINCASSSQKRSRLQKDEGVPKKRRKIANEQQGWNCFDVAVNLSEKLNIQKENAEQSAISTRQTFVKYVIDHKEEIKYRQLLAPEIKHAAALTVTYMIIDEADDAEKMNRAVALEELFQLREMIEAMDGGNTYNRYLIDKNIEQLLENKSLLEFPRGSLPEIMRTEELKRIVIDYQNAHENMKPVVTNCNDLLGFPEGKRKSCQELTQHFEIEENRLNNPKAFEVFREGKERELLLYERKFDNFCERSDIYENYVQHYYGISGSLEVGGWFAFQREFSDEKSTSMVDIASLFLEKQIIIKSQTGDIIYRTQAADFQQTVEIQFNGFNHFEAIPNFSLAVDTGSASDIVKPLMIEGKTSDGEDFIVEEDIELVKEHSKQDLPLIELANRTVTEEVNQERFTHGIQESAQSLSKASDKHAQVHSERNIKAQANKPKELIMKAESIPSLLSDKPKPEYITKLAKATSSYREFKQDYIRASVYDLRIWKNVKKVHKDLLMNHSHELNPLQTKTLSRRIKKLEDPKRHFDIKP